MSSGCPRSLDCVTTDSFLHGTDKSFLAATHALAILDHSSIQHNCCTTREPCHHRVSWVYWYSKRRVLTPSCALGPLVFTARSAAPFLRFPYFGVRSGLWALSSFAHLVDKTFGRVFLVCLDHNLVVSEPVDEVKYVGPCSAMPRP